MKDNRLRTLLLVLAALLFATPALAQRNADEEDSMILGASTEMFNAYQRNDSFEGDQHCRALRDMLHDLRFHSSDKYRGAMDMVERHCGEWEKPAPRAEAPAPQPAPKASEPLPASVIPANVTGDARIIWGLIDRSNDLVVANDNLPKTDPVRIANFQRARELCLSGLPRAAGAGPGAEGALHACAAFAYINIDHDKGCSEMRLHVAELYVEGADTGPLADWVGPNRQYVPFTLTDGACKLG